MANVGIILEDEALLTESHDKGTTGQIYVKIPSNTYENVMHVNTIQV